MRTFPGRARVPVAVLAVFAAAACGRSSTGSDNTPPRHDVTIVENAANAGVNAFSPSTIVISLATQTRVVWYNADFTSSTYGGEIGIAHRLASDDGTTFGPADIAPKGTLTATFSSTGAVPYHCTIHPGMVGTVTVNP